MKNTKQKARHIVTGFSLWRRTRDSLSLRFPNQPSRAAVRSASSTAAPFSPRCIVRRTRSVKTLTPRNAPLGSNLHAFQKQQPIRKRVWVVAGGGQEIRNTPETFHLVPPSVKKPGFKPFFHIRIPSAFTAFHQSKGHIKDTESSSSTATVTRQRLFFFQPSIQEVNKYRYSS